MKRAWLTVLLLASKWGMAAALTFALTLPMTTCQTMSGRVHEHRVELTLANFWTILCFVWPFPILIGRTFWRKMRTAYQVVILECVLDVIASVWLLIGQFAAQLVSLGGIQSGSGYKLASNALLGYLLLSGIDLGILLRERSGAHLQPAAQVDAIS